MGRRVSKSQSFIFYNKEIEKCSSSSLSILFRTKKAAANRVPSDCVYGAGLSAGKVT